MKENQNIQFIKDGGVTTALGFMASAVCADIKGKGGKKNDLALLVSEFPCNVASVFTCNIVKAAPVICSIKLLEDRTDQYFGILVNSGNANACTGEKGIKDALFLLSEIEKELNFPSGSILPASTGVIGNYLPVERMHSYLPSLAESVEDANGDIFAKAIMTTDTVSKQHAVLVTTPSDSFVIGGCCKGAGMIDPSMATLLCFITTDANISSSFLKKALKIAVEESFNRITVDGDMSTNDSIYLLANKSSNFKVSEETYGDLFIEALKLLCTRLALDIVEDAEGGNKCVKITVVNAKTVDDARNCSRKIALSPLVKTMFTGNDPNWGRLMASAGASGAKFDPEKTDIFFNEILFVTNGTINKSISEDSIVSIMKNKSYEIKVDLKAGESSYFYYTSDLSTEYVNINADYRS